MEVYTARGISTTLPLLSPKSIPLQSHKKTNLSLTPKSPTIIGLQYYGKSLCLSVKSTPSNETSTETTSYLENEPRFGVVNSDDTRKVEVEKEEDFGGGQTNEVPEDGSDNFQLLKFLEDLGVKVDYEDTSSLLVFGGGGVFALWLAAAVVGAIDSIPLVPNVLELVGLGYTVWFSSRYLLFKKTREELVAIIEEIKQQVLGAQDD